MPPTKFSRALYDFEAFLEVEKNLSPRTRRAYIYDLERFADYWIARNGANPTLAAITTDDVRQYLEYLRLDKDYKSTTLSRNIASIRVFFDYCVAQGLIEASPALHIHNPKNPRKLPIFLIESELKRLLGAPEEQRETREKTQGRKRRRDYAHLADRDYAILVTFAFTGVRLRELVGLDMKNLDFERKTILVMGKGAKERMIPINQIVVEALRKWVKVRRAAEGERAVFVNRFGRRISPRGVQMVVDKYVQAAGIDKDKISPHKLRHTFATLLHLNGVDIVEIQALMGHATITSTQIYTHVGNERLESAVRGLESIGGDIPRGDED